MPTVTVAPDELRRFTGHADKSDDELKSDLFNLGLEYEGDTEEGEFELEFAPDRLDRLSVEGVARSLRYQYGDARGVLIPSTNSYDWVINVEDVPDQRPYVTGAVVRGVSFDTDALDSIIQLQEKLHATIGRDRVKGAIGIHDLTMLKGSPATNDQNAIRYTGIGPDDDTFVPLDSDVEMTPGSVLTDHPTGSTYASVLVDYDRYPAIYDDIGLFSFPPIINGRRTEVSTDSRDLFIELTGTDQWTIDRMLSILCYAFHARGATIEEVLVSYPDHDIVRPDFEPRNKTVEHARIERVLGIDLEPTAVIDLLERSGLDADRTEIGDDETAYEVAIPTYRVDVLHPLDIVDDVGRAYGFNDLIPRYPDVSTIGGRHDRSRLERSARDVLVGLGFQDLLNFHLTNPPANFDRLQLAPDQDYLGARSPVMIEEPYSEEYSMVRTWCLPSLLMVLENNTHRSYPQDLAEIGFVAWVDETEPTNVHETRTVAGVLARPEVSFEDGKARLQALATRFDSELETPRASHPSFIDGRVATVQLDGAANGVIGEVHPAVLVEHDLELPVVAFEFDLTDLA